MELPHLFELKKRKYAPEEQTGKEPWQIGTGAENGWKFPACSPDPEESAKRKYQAFVRIKKEEKIAKDIESKIKYENRRLPKIVSPSADNVSSQQEPMVVTESDLQRTYNSRPPKISQSLIDLLDKHYGPSERTHHPSYLDLPVVETEPKVKLTKTEKILLKTKFSERIANEKKNTRLEMSRMIEARIQALKRLKEGYTKEEKTYKCHYHERMAAVATEKEEYVKLLAERFNCEVGLLEPKADSLYNFHKSLKKQMEEKEKNYIENSLKWMERLMNEEEQGKKLNRESNLWQPKKRALLPLGGDKTVAPPMEIKDIEYPESGEQLQIDESPQSREKSGDEFPGDKIETPRKSSAGRRSSGKRRSSSKRRSSRRKSSGKESKTRGKGSSLRKGMKKLDSSRSSEKKSLPTNLEPYVEPIPDSLLDPHLVKMFGEWEKRKDALGELGFSPDNLPPTDTMYYTKPKSILINNFQSNVEYRKPVKLISRSKLRSYCRPYLIKMVPDEDLGVLKVEPWTALSSPPGIHPLVTIVFSPLDTTRRIEADIIFLTRHRPKTWRSFSIHVSCIPPSPQIAVNPVFIKFPPRKIWSQDVLIDHFTVVNKGSVPCTLAVRRADAKGCFPFPEEWELLGEEVEDDSHTIRIESLFCIYPSIKFRELKSKNPRDQVRSDKNDENVDVDEKQDIVAYMVERIFAKVFENYTVNRKYDVEIPGRSRVRVSIAFKPRFAPYVGTVHEQWCLTFTDSSHFCRSETLNIFAEIETTPLYVKPAVLDLKLCLLNSGVQQRSFTVGNRGRRCHQLLVKLPAAMRDQASIHNPEPLILGGEEVKILVRLELKYSFCSECKEFYDPDTNILDFPVHVSSKDEDETGPPLEVRVMAVVTRSMGLKIAPEYIDYGVVYTYQSAIFPIHLTNNSMATHRYGFLNLPKWVMIQPGYGFGMIGPGEKLRLDLIYSPTTEQISWPGGAAEHFFVLIVTTMDRLANHVPYRKLITTDHQYKVLQPREFDIKQDESPPPILSQTLDTPEEVEEVTEKVTKSTSQKGSGLKKESTASAKHSKKAKRRRSTPQKMTETESEEVQIDESPFNFEFVMPNFDELLELYKRSSVFGDELQPNRAEDYLKSCNENMSALVPVDGETLEKMSTVKHANETAPENIEEETSYQMCSTPDPVLGLLAVRAVVIDPHCELSAQKIVLPSTPFYSYTITPFYLRCPNMQSHKICYCGKGAKGIYKAPPTVKAKFEFFSDLKFIDVQPCSGFLRSGEELKLKVLVRPRLSEVEIVQRAKILKAISERDRLLRERQQRWSRKKSKKSGGKLSRKSASSRRASKRASSTAAKAPSATAKRKSATGKRKSATGKRKSAAGKRKSAAGGGKKKIGQEKSKPGKKKTSKDRKLTAVSEAGDIVVDPEQMQVNETDLFNAKLNLMRYKEPVEFEAKIDCLIETELVAPPYTRRKEQLELFVYGTLVRPDIAVFTPSKLDQHITFETTAVGMKRKLTLEVYNTSGRTVLLNHSCFGASESFYVPLRLPLDQMRPNHFLKTGIWLDPDHHVSLPVIFAPKAVKTVSEYIEMRSNSTVVPLKFKGRGVEPKFKITPEFLVGKLRSFTGAPVLLPVWIENQCEAELEFSLDKLYTKEGPMFDLGATDASSSKPSKSRKSAGRKSAARQSTARKSVSKKSVSGKGGARKSMARKSTARKSVTGKKPSKKSGKSEPDEDAVQVQKGDLKVEGRKNVNAPGSEKKRHSQAFKSNNYDEAMSGELVNLLTQEFFPVAETKQEHMFRVDTKIRLKPHESKKILVEFQPFKPVEPEQRLEQEISDSKVDRASAGRKSGVGSRKSVARKSITRKSVARENDAQEKEGQKIDTPKKAARKSVARKSVARKSVARKSLARKSVARKSVAKKEVARKSSAGSLKKRSRGGSGTSKKSVGKKIDYVVDEAMYGKTYASKIRLTLGASSKIIDWWFMGQVFPGEKKPEKSTSKLMK